jgi:opacity protein-like surface antigen
MQMRILGLGAACLLAFASPATADEDDYSRSGMYVGLAGTYAFDMGLEDQADAALSGTGGNASVDNALGLNMRVGYRVMPYLAYEANYEWIPSFDVKAGGETALEQSYSMVTLNAKGYYPLERFQPYVLLGVGMLLTSGNDNAHLGIPVSNAGFATRWGAGLDFHITNKFLFTLESTYMLPFGDVKDSDYLSLVWGLQFRL